MTLTELKSLKVGQIVKYTNDIDPLNIEYWKVRHINDFLVEMIALNTEGVCLLLKFDELGIEHTASMLTVDEPLSDKALKPERELRLIEAKIRDAEFDLTNFISYNELLFKFYQCPDGAFQLTFNKIQAELISLRNQRNELIEKI